jgi:hypothetical protein
VTVTYQKGATKRRVWWLTTELDNCGVDTQLFGTEHELKDAVSAILQDAWDEVDGEGALPEDTDAAYDKLQDTHWADDSSMIWGWEDVELPA